MGLKIIPIPAKSNITTFVRNLFSFIIFFPAVIVNGIKIPNNKTDHTNGVYDKICIGSKVRLAIIPSIPNIIVQFLKGRFII